MNTAPERQLSSRSVFKGRVVSVRVDEVRLPGGKSAIREVVDHRPAVVIVPIDEFGRILMVKQYRYAVGETLLEAPAGIVEEGEDPDDTAQRELQEEIGRMAGDLRKLGEFWATPGFCNEMMHAYVARDLRHSSLDADEDEDITVVPVPMAEALDMIANGQIRDAKTIAALLLANHKSAHSDQPLNTSG